MIHIFVVMIDALTSKFFCLGHGLQHQGRIRRVEFPIPRPLRSVVRILQVKYSNLLQNIYNIFTIWIKNISNTKTFALGGLDIASEFTSCNESHAHVHLIPTKPLFFFEKVQRDSEPGGHDAWDRDGPDQPDLPHHLRPSHLPAVQPPGLLWRLSGLSLYQVCDNNDK